MALQFDGSRMILKDNRVSAVTLAEHLGQLGITTDAAELFDAMVGNGKALCVIDGADRLLTSERRPVVIDLLRAIARCKTAERWQILTSARSYQDRDLVADALAEAGYNTHGASIAIENLFPADLEALGRAFPSSAGLLNRQDLSGQNRSLFLLRELLKRAAPPAGLWSELDIADAWAGGDLADHAQSACRARALAQIASALCDTPWRLPGRSEICAEGLAVLIDEGAAMQLPNHDALRLVHDVHEDWLLARHLRSRAGELVAILRAADQPLWWLRAVRLAAQQMLEQGDFAGWQRLIGQLDAAGGLDPVWTRAILAAPFYSERSESILDGLVPTLLAHKAQLLRRLLDTLIVSETRLDERILTLLADRDEATRYAMASYWKEPVYRSWIPFLRWSLPLWASWPVELIPRLSEIAMIFSRVMTQVPNGHSRSIAVIVWRWLIEIEDVRPERPYSNRAKPFGLELDDHSSWEQIEERLRDILVASVASAPRVMRQYLERLATTRGLRGAREKLLQSPGAVPAHLPVQWTDMCLRQFVQFRASAERMVGKDRLAEFLRLYPASTDAEANASAGAFTGDIVIGEQTWQWLELQRQTGGAPVYGYKFTYTSPYTPIASHITDVPFVFGTLTPQFIIGSKTPPAAADRAFSDKLMAYWVNFATKGDPNGPGLPVWPAYQAGGAVQELGTTIAPRANPQLERFRFIASFRDRGVFPARWRELP